jgi:sarcosine oxidase subunit beta
VIDFAQSLYFHREGEGLLTGQSNPHEQPGYDESVDPCSGSWRTWRRRSSGCRCWRTQDAPHTGPVSTKSRRTHTRSSAPCRTLAGYYVITGFSGHGFMHGPGAGLLLSEIILDGQRAHARHRQRWATTASPRAG